ncbi:hypothetical protein EMCRGX_G007973 [Ephydatia muelleri]
MSRVFPPTAADGWELVSSLDMLDYKNQKCPNQLKSYDIKRACPVNDAVLLLFPLGAIASDKYVGDPKRSSSKTSPVDDFPSVKDSDQSRRKDSKWSPAISEDDPPSEGESSHSVDEDPKSSPKSRAISEDDPPSEGESSHSVDENSKSSPQKSGAISEDDPPSEGESSHSVDEDPKSSPPKSGAISEAPKSCTFSVHTSDEDSTSASICECKTRCATRRCPCKQIGSFCSKYCHPNRTCVNSHQEASETEPLSLSTEEETPVEKVWTTIGETTLLEEEKSILMNRKWLNDKIIKAGMHLLKTAFPHISGFQDPMLQVTNTFNIQKSTEFIQCLNVAGMHWITIATVGCTPGTVRVYDSLNKKLTKALKNTVADLLHSSTKKIEVEYVNCQYQQGSEDCGLFAIANACELCFGGDPSVVKYTQDDMRKHLLKAFDTLRLMQFPSKMRRVSQHVLQREFIDIYCTCRMPNNERICQSKVPNGVQDVEMPHPPTKLVGVASGDRTETAVANSTDETTYAVVDRTKKVISMADSPPPVPAPLNEGDETPVAMYALLGQPDLIP